jgi:hypothetical protein
MLKKMTALALAGLLLNVVCAVPIRASGGKQDKKDAKHAAKIKRQIGLLGKGPEAHVELKLRDQTELEGYVSETSADHFVITDEKSAALTTVTYAQVEKLKFIPTMKTIFERETKPKRFARNMAFSFLVGVPLVVLLCLAVRKCQE